MIYLFKEICFFNRDLTRGCLVYRFSLRFSGSKFLINLRRQFRVRIILFTQVFLTYVLGCSFIKSCSLTGCYQAFLF